MTVVRNNRPAPAGATKKEKNPMNNMVSEPCPRCGDSLRQSPYDLGALSRYDNETVVCRCCGMHEALVHANCGVAELHPVTGLRPWRAWQGAPRH